MNSKLWGKFRRHVPRMTAPLEKIELNPIKRVYNSEHMDQTYITFESDWKNEDGEDVKSWINLDEEEWEAFVKILWQINQVIPSYQRYTCVGCLDEQIRSICGAESCVVPSLTKLHLLVPSMQTQLTEQDRTVQSYASIAVMPL